MPTLINFKIGYKGGPAYFSGTGSTQVVPFIYPVAVNGRPYMIDTKSSNFL